MTVVVGSAWEAGILQCHSDAGPVLGGCRPCPAREAGRPCPAREAAGPVLPERLSCPGGWLAPCALSGLQGCVVPYKCRMPRSAGTCSTVVPIRSHTQYCTYCIHVHEQSRCVPHYKKEERKEKVRKKSIKEKKRLHT